MMSFRLSPSLIAIRAVLGEFFGRRTLLSGAVLTALAAWGGGHLPVQGTARVATVGVLLATAGTVSTIAWTWVLSGRWHDMALLPVQIKDLTRAVYVVSMFVALIEAIVPAATFIAISLSASEVHILSLIFLGLGTAPVILLLWSATFFYHRLMAGVIIIAIVVATEREGPTYGATIAFISATLCIAVGFEVGSDKIRTSGKRVVGTYYLAFGELLGSPATQINSLVLVTAGIAINLSLQRHGSFWLIGFALAVSNTPLNSYFSRNPTTWLVLRTCPRTWVFYAQFACQLFVCHAVCATIVTLAPGWSATRTPVNLVAAFFAAVVAAVVATTMEMFYPLTNWKSEREVLRHPRKYVPGVAAFIAASCSWLISSAF